MNMGKGSIDTSQEIRGEETVNTAITSLAIVGYLFMDRSQRIWDIIQKAGLRGDGQNS